MNRVSPKTTIVLSEQKPLQSDPAVKGTIKKSYFGRIFTLCVICCAAPYVLIAFGVIGVSAGAYLGLILESFLILTILLSLVYFALRLVKNRK